MNGLETPAPLEKNEGKKGCGSRAFGKERMWRRVAIWRKAVEYIPRLDEAHGRHDSGRQNEERGERRILGRTEEIKGLNVRREAAAAVQEARVRRAVGLKVERRTSRRAAGACHAAGRADDGRRGEDSS